MNDSTKTASLAMREIIDGYLVGKYDRNEAVKMLIFDVDHDVIHGSDTEFIVTDCYHSIKHLIEPGFETSDFELKYFLECFDGQRAYDLQEKIELTRKHFNSV